MYKKNVGFLICLSAAYFVIHLSTFEVKAMTSILEQASSLLKLPSADYLRFSEEQQLQLQQKLAGLARASAAADKNLHVFALGAPSEINLGEHPKVPVLVGSSRTGLRDWQVNFNTNLNLFVRNLESGELRVIRPLVNVRRGGLELLSGKGAPPVESEVTSRTSSVIQVELERLTPGLHVVSGLSHDTRANTVTINITGPSAAVRDQPKSVPPYLQHTLNRSVDLPTRVELRGAAGASGPALLGIAIQIRADDGVIKSSAGQHAWQSNLVLVKLDETPIIIPVYLPVQEVSAPDGTPAFNAVFAVDWGKVKVSPGFSDLSGTFQIYLDAGHRLLGPYALRK